MTHLRSDSLLIGILRWSAGLCLAGWAWVQLYWEGPYGILLWNAETFAWAENWGMDWAVFVGTGANDGLVQLWLGALGGFFVLCAGVTFSARRESKLQLAVLGGGTGLLVVLAYAKYLSAQKQIPMFVEHGAQMLSPALLVMALTLGVRHRATVVVAIIALIATFAGHGYYAVGWLPTPGNFHAMTSLVLGVEYETANLFLRIAGTLDFVVCIGILIPAVRRLSALYATLWGLVTALARPVAGMSWDLNYWGADQFVHEGVLRAPHFLLPFFLYLLWRGGEEDSTVQPTGFTGPEVAENKPD
ncbi:hypothetical protein N9023_00490 [Opitutaceae bacterium]|nr:hypothetical protein [Opitutaceae bacterium]MDB4473456.1 hypothetical protein [Opitutaceae bacterium]